VTRLSADDPVMTERYRSRKHLTHVKAQGRCCIPGCRATDIDPAHLRFAQPGGLGIKPGDQFTVNLCRRHHNEQHRVGDEVGWWEAKKHLIPDPIEIALRLWFSGPGPADVARAA
jgi:hypothetical protein